MITKRERRWHSKGPQNMLYNTFRISLLAVFKPQKLLFWSKVSYNIRRNIRDLSQSLHSKCIWSQWHLMKKARNYLFTSGNKFQDNNCTWLSGSMNIWIMNMQLPQNYTWSTENEWEWIVDQLIKMQKNSYSSQGVECYEFQPFSLKCKVWPISHPCCGRCSLLGTIRGSPRTRPDPQLHPHYNWLGVSSAAEVPGNWPAS